MKTAKIIKYIGKAELSGELWKTIKGYKGRYRVSNYGRVSSRSKRSGIKILQSCLAFGYNTYNLCKNSKAKWFRGARLVATYFIRKPRLNEVVNHIDGSRNNDHVDNLEIVTQRENLTHCKKRKSDRLTGAAWSEADQCWRSSIKIKRTSYSLGSFPTELLAHKAYIKELERRNLKNKYAYTNQLN